MGNRNSGRRPQPTALKVLRGNPGKRTLNPDEPTPPAGAVVKPRLSSTAGLVWDRLAPIAIAMRTLTAADVTTFGTLCELQATLEGASRSKEPRRKSERLRAFTARLSHAIKIEKDFAPILRPYYALFGFEPVSRAKIAVPKPAAEKTPAPSKWTGVLR